MSPQRRQDTGNQEQCSPCDQLTRERVSSRRGSQPPIPDAGRCQCPFGAGKGKTLRDPKAIFSGSPFLPELLGKPYPKGYKPLKFHPFDGRNGSAVEHVSRFIHTMGPYAGDRELCLREFAKSLVDRAYTWYTTLRPGSIKTWDEMMERFCAKYYLGKDKVTFQSL